MWKLVCPFEANTKEWEAVRRALIRLGVIQGDGDSEGYLYQSLEDYLGRRPSRYFHYCDPQRDGGSYTVEMHVDHEKGEIRVHIMGPFTRPPCEKEIWKEWMLSEDERPLAVRPSEEPSERRWRII